jgi:hypothetical protein
MVGDSTIDKSKKNLYLYSNIKILFPWENQTRRESTVVNEGSPQNKSAIPPLLLSWCNVIINLIQIIMAIHFIDSDKIDITFTNLIN